MFYFHIETDHHAVTALFERLPHFLDIVLVVGEESMRNVPGKYSNNCCISYFVYQAIF